MRGKQREGKKQPKLLHNTANVTQTDEADDSPSFLDLIRTTIFAFFLERLLVIRDVKFTPKITPPKDEIKMNKIHGRIQEGMHSERSRQRSFCQEQCCRDVNATTQGSVGLGRVANAHRKNAHQLRWAREGDTGFQVWAAESDQNSKWAKEPSAPHMFSMWRRRKHNRWHQEYSFVRTSIEPRVPVPQFQANQVAFNTLKSSYAKTKEEKSQGSLKPNSFILSGPRYAPQTGWDFAPKCLNKPPQNQNCYHSLKSRKPRRYFALQSRLQ